MNTEHPHCQIDCDSMMFCSILIPSESFIYQFTNVLPQLLIALEEKFGFRILSNFCLLHFCSRKNDFDNISQIWRAYFYISRKYSVFYEKIQVPVPVNLLNVLKIWFKLNCISNAMFIIQMYSNFNKIRRF